MSNDTRIFSTGWLDKLLSSTFLSKLRDKRVGEVVQIAYSERTDQPTLNSISPNSQPVITSGTEIFSTTITPKSIGNYFIIECSGNFSEEVNQGSLVSMALFLGGGANAISAISSSKNATNSFIDGYTGLKLNKKYAITTLDPISFSVRAGFDSGTNGILNKVASLGTRYDFGGSSMLTSYLKITEVQQ